MFYCICRLNLPIIYEVWRKSAQTDKRDLTEQLLHGSVTCHLLPPGICHCYLLFTSLTPPLRFQPEQGGRPDVWDMEVQRDPSQLRQFI